MADHHPIAAPTTIVQQFRIAVEKFGDLPALRYKSQQQQLRVVAAAVPFLQGGSVITSANRHQQYLQHSQQQQQQQQHIQSLPQQHQHQWEEVSWNQYFAMCCAVGRSIVALKVPIGGTVHLMGENSPFYLYSHMGCMLAGAVSVAVQNADASTSYCTHIAAECEAHILILEGVEQLARYIDGVYPLLPSAATATAPESATASSSSDSTTIPSYSSSLLTASMSSSGTFSSSLPPQHQQRSARTRTASTQQLQQQHTGTIADLTKLKAIVVWGAGGRAAATTAATATSSHNGDINNASNDDTAAMAAMAQLLNSKRRNRVKRPNSSSSSSSKYSSYADAVNNGSSSKSNKAKKASDDNDGDDDESPTAAAIAAGDTGQQQQQQTVEEDNDIPVYSWQQFLECSLVTSDTSFSTNSSTSSASSNSQCGSSSSDSEGGSNKSLSGSVESIDTTSDPEGSISGRYSSSNSNNNNNSNNISNNNNNKKKKKSSSGDNSDNSSSRGTIHRGSAAAAASEVELMSAAVSAAQQVLEERWVEQPKPLSLSLAQPQPSRTAGRGRGRGRADDHKSSSTVPNANATATATAHTTASSSSVVITPEHTACIVYQLPCVSSNELANDQPLGVMLSHDNITWSAQTAVHTLQQDSAHVVLSGGSAGMATAGKKNNNNKNNKNNNNNSLSTTNTQQSAGRSSNSGSGSGGASTGTGTSYAAMGTASEIEIAAAAAPLPPSLSEQEQATEAAEAGDRVISYMPLHNITAQMLDCFWPLVSGACVYILPHQRSHMLLQCIREAKPTLFFGTARTWQVLEHVARAFEQEKGADSWWRRVVGNKMARDIGLRASLMSQYHDHSASEDCDCNCYPTSSSSSSSGSTSSSTSDRRDANATASVDEDSEAVFIPRPFGYKLASNILLDSLKAELGLDQCIHCYSGPMGIEEDTWTYLASLDIPVMQLYGTEHMSGIHSLSTRCCWEHKFCGRPLYGTFSKADPRSRELGVKGPHVCTGFVKQANKYADCFDFDGFFRTGDAAFFDMESGREPTALSPTGSSSSSSIFSSLIPSSGLLHVVGKVSDSMISSQGNRIDPTVIERAVMRELGEVVSHCVAVADGREFVSVLISLKTVHEIRPKDSFGSSGGSRVSGSSSCSSSSSGSSSSSRTHFDTTNSVAFSTTAVRKSGYVGSKGIPTDRLTAECIRVGQYFGSTAKLYSAAIRDPLWIQYITNGIARANVAIARQLNRPASGTMIFAPAAGSRSRSMSGGDGSFVPHDSAARPSTTSAGTFGIGTSSSSFTFPYEVRRWVFLPHELSQRSGELSANHTVKRKQVLNRYSGLIADTYAQPTFTHVLVNNI